MSKKFDFGSFEQLSIFYTKEVQHRACGLNPTSKQKFLAQ